MGSILSSAVISHLTGENLVHVNCISSILSTLHNLIPLTAMPAYALLKQTPQGAVLQPAVFVLQRIMHPPAVVLPFCFIEAQLPTQKWERPLICMIKQSLAPRIAMLQLKTLKFSRCCRYTHDTRDELVSTEHTADAQKLGNEGYRIPSAACCVNHCLREMIYLQCSGCWLEVVALATMSGERCHTIHDVTPYTKPYTKTRKQERGDLICSRQGEAIGRTPEQRRC